MGNRQPDLPRRRSNGKEEATYQDIRDDRVYTYFDLAAGQTKSFRVMLTATYAGSCTAGSELLSDVRPDDICPYARPGGRSNQIQS